MELRLGEKQTLVVVKKVEFGVYLATKEAPEDKVLLPAKQVPEGAKVGDELEVFLYRDSSDRLISTTRTPKLCMGQVALLTVVQVGKVGAFLDWGASSAHCSTGRESRCFPGLGTGEGSAPAL